ncbi:MAG: YciI family protein [Geitlerinemataceae cyanobacterium]
MPWFAKIESGIVEKPTFDRFVPAHKAYVRDLIEKGHQARSGYWQRRGGGMMIFQAESMAAAKAIVERDPLVKNGCVHYELYEWCVVIE